MPDIITTILVGLLIVAILWVLLKLVFRLTMRIFSCGCVLIVVIAAILFFSGAISIS